MFKYKEHGHPARVLSEENFMFRRCQMILVALLALVATPALANYCKTAMVQHANDFSHGMWHFGQSVSPTLSMDWATLMVLNSTCMSSTAGAMFWVGFAVPLVALLLILAGLAWKWRVIASHLSRWLEYNSTIRRRRLVFS